MSNDKNAASKQLSKDILPLFTDKNLVCVATLMEDGSPQITPTWVDVDESQNTILVNTAKGRVKQKNLARDPRIAVAVVDRNNPYNVATIRGRWQSRRQKGRTPTSTSWPRNTLDLTAIRFAIEASRGSY